MAQFKNLDKLNKTKRDGILRGLEHLSDTDTDGIISRVSIFGSSTRDDCTEESDVDMVLYTDVNTTDMRLFRIYGSLPIAMDETCDILIFSQIPEGSFKQKISETEVVVYEA